MSLKSVWRRAAEALGWKKIRPGFAERADSPSFYIDAFFVPPKARWAHLRDELSMIPGFTRQASRRR